MSLGLDNYRHRKVITVVGGLLLLSLIITITVEFVVMSTMIYFMLSCNVRLSCSLPPPPPPPEALELVKPLIWTMALILISQASRAEHDMIRAKTVRPC